MIIVNAIIIEGTANPEKKDYETKFGNHFDGINFYYFESEQERKDYYNNSDELIEALTTS